MSNRPISGNTLLTRSTQALGARLPDGWRLSTTSLEQTRLPGYQPDARLDIRSPDGRRAVLWIEAKSRLTAQDAAILGPRLSAQASTQADGALVVAPFLSELARARLYQAGVSYADLTGNARVTIKQPAVLIETQGASKDPSPPRRSTRSLKGPKAARLVRALCDWRAPVGVRELARRAGTDPGYATRVLTLLERDDVITRSKGEVIEVRWQDLIRRWAQDYQVAESNRAVPYLAPRGIGEFLAGLQQYDGRWALTGSLAVPREASVSPSRLASCYVDMPDRAAAALDLRQTDTGANVLLLDPFDDVVWARLRTEDGRTLVAASQCAADLLTGSGREPSEAESLLEWMKMNESAWRA